jgi:hypothetical protein
MAFEMIEKYRIYHCESGDVKKTDNIEEGSFLFETDTGYRYIFNGTAWVYFPESIQISDGTDNVRITNGGLDVNIQDQYTEIIDLHLTQLVQVITIVTNTSVDDTTITISSASEPTDGNNVCLKEGTAFYQGHILSHVANGGNWDITLDTPLDFAFTTAGGCSERSENLAVNGSVTPQRFTVSPKGLAAGTEWDITRIMGVIVDAEAMDDSKFGGITGGLTKGVVFRRKDGTYKNIFAVRTNGDLAAHMYDVTYVDATRGPAGNESIRFRRTFGGQDKAGVVIRLCADTDDEFECIIQDDLTGLVDFQIIAQGHVVE